MVHNLERANSLQLEVWHMELMKSKFLMERKMDTRQESAFQDFLKVQLHINNNRPIHNGLCKHF